MSIVNDGGCDAYSTKLKMKYNGMYSKIIDYIYFRGEAIDEVTEYGFSIKRKHSKYNMIHKYCFRLDKSYDTDDVRFINIDSLLYDYFHSKRMSPEIDVSVNEILSIERNYKIKKLQNKTRKKSLIKKIFKW